MKAIKFPQVRQAYEYDCGAEVARGVLAFHGKDIKEETLLKLAKTDTKTGTLVDNLVKILKKYGIGYKEKTFSVPDLKKTLDKGHPVILLIQAWPGRKITDWKKNWKSGHYVAAIGYDNKKIYFADPYSAFRTYLTYDELESRWRHRDPRGREYVNFGIEIARPKKPYDFDRAVHMD
ncbi:MAG: C39 family peptidase [Candidatus Colwellbacteria bacterium]|nr:C39 family peptidase [Candidatus Colwellbacteria bacterium]